MHTCIHIDHILSQSCLISILISNQPGNHRSPQVTIGHHKSPIHVIVFSPFGFMLSIAIPSSYKVVLPAMSVGLSPP